VNYIPAYIRHHGYITERHRWTTKEVREAEFTSCVAHAADAAAVMGHCKHASRSDLATQSMGHEIAPATNADQLGDQNAGNRVVSS
jgi:hypothetical protein